MVGAVALIAGITPAVGTAAADEGVWWVDATCEGNAGLANSDRFANADTGGKARVEAEVSCGAARAAAMAGRTGLVKGTAVVVAGVGIVDGGLGATLRSIVGA